jgi:hypothetical protein
MMRLLFIVITLFQLTSVNAKALSEKKIINDYKSILKKFRKNMCTAEDSRSFWRFTKETHRGGFFIPLNSKEGMDIQTIQKMLPRVREKKQWIESNIKRVKKDKSFKRVVRSLERFKGDLKLLVGFKRKFFEEKTASQRLAISQLSKHKLRNFYQELRQTLESVYFLHTFNFPADHKSMRRDYDSFKVRSDMSGIKRANEIFFLRKLVEDGVRHPRWRGNDRSIRTLINTTYIRSIKNSEESFIDEDLRYDLEWLLERLIDYLKFDISLIVKRLERWEKSTEKMYRFYISLLEGSVNIDGKTIPVKQFIEGNGRSRKTLKDFVYKKQADVYEFWTKQSRVNRVLFVMDTIILNEVGGTNDPGELEKKEVLKVVLNRSELNFYSSLSPKDSIYSHLEKKNIPTKKYPWLNLMLKEGEFSFTYYFLSASNHVFCPDMSPRAKDIRKKSLEIGLKLLKNKKVDTEAVRYFSRASMLGRMDMTDLWSGFRAIAEKPGRLIDDPKVIERVTSHDYDFLYSFTDDQKKIFQVVIVGEKKYTLGSKGQVFSYRNPHNFRYFAEK